MDFSVNLDNLTKEEQEQFSALVEKANKPKSKVWKPEIGETYYNIADNVYSSTAKQEYEDESYDNLNYTIGNFFKTREEAEFALERLKVIAEMKRYIVEHDDVELDWGDYQQCKYCIRYSHSTNSICTDYNINTQFFDSSLYASSRKIMKNMIKEIGEDRIKKYYFGVKENE